jgi:hypothetical protein
MLHFISDESWTAFCEMRKKIRAPLTPYAERLILLELTKLKSAGHDPQKCLDQSIMLGWRDIWPVKHKDIPTIRKAAEDTQTYLAELSGIKADPGRVRDALAAAKSSIRRVA